MHAGPEIVILRRPDQGGAAELELGTLKLQADAVVVLQLHQPEFGLVGKGAKR
ncbi:hypothetical protein D3C81_2266040 [compost metagenome]